MEDGEFLPGVNTGNTREGIIKAFLSKPPKRTHKLVMFASVAAGDPVVLAEWERDEIVPLLAGTIVDRLEEHAVEVGGVVHCTLTFEDQNGKALATKVIKRQSNHVENERELVVKSLQGDPTALVVQAQLTMERMGRLYMGGIATSMGQNERNSERMAAMLDRAMARLEKVEDERDQLRDALQELENIVRARDAEGGAESSPISETQARAIGLLEKLVPVLLQRMLAPSAVASAASPS
jgi:hypothetical protein